MKAAVKALNLPDYTPETEGYSVEEEREHQNKKWVKIGYRATLTTRFETSDIARLAAGGGVKVGELLQVAESAGRGNYFGQRDGTVCHAALKV